MKKIKRRVRCEFPPIPYPAAFVFRLAFPHSLLLLPIFIFFPRGKKPEKNLSLALSQNSKSWKQNKKESPHLKLERNKTTTATTATTATAEGVDDVSVERTGVRVIYII